MHKAEPSFRLVASQESDLRTIERWKSRQIDLHFPGYRRPIQLGRWRRGAGLRGLFHVGDISLTARPEVNDYLRRIQCDVGIPVSVTGQPASRAVRSW